MIAEKDALRGSVIVMNPRNGEILAYAVYPTYDPNKFQKASNTEIKIDINRCLSSGFYFLKLLQ